MLCADLRSYTRNTEIVPDHHLISYIAYCLYIMEDNLYCLSLLPVHHGGLNVNPGGLLYMLEVYLYIMEVNVYILEVKLYVMEVNL